MASTAPKRGLGKGLGALIPSAGTTASTPTSTAAPRRDVAAASAAAPVSHGAMDAAQPAAAYAELAITQITANPRQPRTVFEEEPLAELIHSLQTVGLLQPIVVRPVDGAYELVAGERRLRAATAAGWDVIPAIIRATDDDDLLRDALLENLHRANLNPLEEAAAYAQLLADFGCTQEVLASRIGRSRPQVSNTLRLLRLPPDVQRRVAVGVLSAGHARALLSLSDDDAIERMATRIVAEGLSVRSVEELIVLGDTGATAKKKSRAATGGRSDQLTDLVDDITRRLADVLDTRVGIDGMRRSNARGKLVIEFADADDLRRLANTIDRR